ncbi:BTAD domain-containing putative transcriptional regulator [Amycolatopsis sp. KNN50.9b]|uniref:BTAD domain-containing putative transcriptional regulator n=1 Tax=Amycolatopsis sp. KNN50.9b TaxID=2018303 RepID=UPI000B8B491D|nr:BTAD domain-containing putative transcriptional regulator [Amycolatopsis sp. KNN50.9b]OXM72663.1 AfsR family transcriptional regulator [Amycolatopsis sp. KNN50.9b]
MRFSVLGPLAVQAASGAAVAVPEAKVRALLADLLVHEGRPVSVARLADDLWGERLPGNPANTLQTKISQLRRTLERAEPGARELVVRQPPGYALRVPEDAVDARRFRALVGRAKASRDPASTAALLREALALWRGPALADFAEEPFAAGYAQRLEEERLAAVEELAEARLALGEHAELAGELGDLVAEHPLRERLRALQMRALYRSGRQSEALASYTDLRERLADELGLEPGPELGELQQAILRQDPALDPPPAAARSNLPVPLTDLIGRETAVREVRQVLERSRLVTLTGPGGVGKTRLALEIAAGLTAPDGVWLVELAGLDEHGPARPAEAVAAVLGVRDDAGDLTARLADAVRGRRLLLVLDNCEHLVEPVAALAARLLAAAPDLRILATSREPLGLTGETLWTVPPLGIPAAGHADPERPAAEVLPSVREFSAVRLFVARAAATAPGFALTEGNVHAVAAICRTLDGLPLALELAATRVRALGVHELLARLGDRFRLLATGARGAPARQRTLRAMIDWSWELLSTSERGVLRRLAVHAEGCGLEAAEEVCGDEPGTVVDVLGRLVDRSLVVSEHGELGPRYRLLESVRAYSLERLIEADEAEPVRSRHARYYAALAERADPLLRGSGQCHWLERLDAEAANLRAALDTLVRQGAADAALRLVTSLAWYWFLRGRLGEALRSLRAALAVPGEVAPGRRAAARAWLAGLEVLAGGRVDPAVAEEAAGIPDVAVRSRALWFLGYVLGTVADLAGASKLTGAALDGFAALGDRWGTAAGLAESASQLIARGELGRASAAAAESAAIFAEVGDRWGQVQASFVLGTLASFEGRYADAERLHTESLERAEQLGLWPEVSYQLSWLGRTALLAGDFAEARRLHERARRVAVESGFTPGEMYARTGLALGARREGALDEAERQLRVLLEWHGLVEHEPGNTLVCDELGFVAELRGDAEGAFTWHRRALEIARRGTDPRAVALALEGLAGAHALAGDHALAARLLGAADAARRSVGAPLPPAERGDVDRIEHAARTALGEKTYTAEHETGARLELEELITETQPA